jgi:hypothetical protein
LDSSLYFLIKFRHGLVEIIKVEVGRSIFGGGKMKLAGWTTWPDKRRSRAECTTPQATGGVGYS